MSIVRLGETASYYSQDEGCTCYGCSKNKAVIYNELASSPNDWLCLDCIAQADLGRSVECQSCDQSATHLLCDDDWLSELDSYLDDHEPECDECSRSASIHYCYNHAPDPEPEPVECDECSRSADYHQCDRHVSPDLVACDACGAEAGYHACYKHRDHRCGEYDCDEPSAIYLCEQHRYKYASGAEPDITPTYRIVEPAEAAPSEDGNTSNVDGITIRWSEV